MTHILSNFAIGLPETEGTTIQCRYRFTPDFIGFSGHFPAYPILPAFVQILLGLDLMSRLAGRPQSMAAIENAKFRLEIHPGDEIAARCTERSAAQKPLYEVRLSVGGQLASSFLLLPAGEEGEMC